MSSKQVLLIVIATFITLVIWVGADIYHSRKQVKTSAEVEKLLEMVNPEFDKQALSKL